MLRVDGKRLVYHYDAEELWIEAWGKNAVRVRATKQGAMPDTDWALTIPQSEKADIEITETGAVLKNGALSLSVSNGGKIVICKEDGTKVFEEYWRNRRDITDPKCSSIEVEAREFRPNVAGDYHVTMRFESLDDNEKIYGMGQYQQRSLELKGCDLELAHRNSQASVPFAVSSLGYGILWNNPAVGRAVFGKNVMSFEAYATKYIDYWFVVGNTPAEIVNAYASVAGTVPVMPEYGLGFWQCKLRYQTQDELMGVAKKYHEMGIPLDMIVCDFFHWPKQGEWKFDKTYWPDPAAMVKELNDMGTELMVSIWPTVDRESENFDEMLEKGFLIRTERGFRTGLNFQGATIHYDATNPGARKYLWDKVKKNYYELGIKTFWLDEAEPEYTVYDFDNYRYFMGTDLEVGNIYPVEYARTFYEGMSAEGQENIVNLLRCAWAGSQRYGALVWSGDIASSFDCMRDQLSAGLNMGIAGIPWWTTDIGGFHGGNPDDPGFRELFARWFEWGTFLPVMRLHGDREPRQPQFGETGGATCRSGAPNEIWSYGEEVLEICKKYIKLRESMRDYIRDIMKQAHEKGSPVMRTLFYEFPEDEEAWRTEDEYMFGDRYLVAPVFEAGARKRQVYLPKGCSWKRYGSDQILDGGRFITADAPLDEIPVFEKVIIC
ncbi:glycoside hydrolase family 31 protein [Butyrivibrio sp. XPD2006]|uniref:glycoside hydrolase family 31 protein n=1 Tax=Butyrivibrio sp. XPD2006 TaxID=1280668 RepID=UPI0003B6E663|nr:TIM-barrel domain-containing protein [Butyrivibrio sp. XPD2006]